MSTTTQKDTEAIHQIVRERYAQIAREGKPVPEATCCGPRPAEVAPRLGYKDTDIAACPKEPTSVSGVVLRWAMPPCGQAKPSSTSDQGRDSMPSWRRVRSVTRVA